MLPVLTGARWPKQGDVADRTGRTGAGTPGLSHARTRFSVDEGEPPVHVHKLVHHIKAGLAKWQARHCTSPFSLFGPPEAAVYFHAMSGQGRYSVLQRLGTHLKKLRKKLASILYNIVLATGQN